ncbi:MAG TPA: HIT domain-containing protein [Candidatus Polarisedimenticolia bacterium]|jgi:ATP adenylyltransferase|nr:HIT domain-containing protein [Candidatus Polarisedimenticolia bacterium]
MERLFSPWRLRYVAAPHPQRGCVFCRAIRSTDDRANLVLHRGRTHFVILNKFPYSNGHLMVVPRAHLSSPAESEPEALLEMMSLTVRAEEALRRAYRPEGINLGMNLGRSAGAGITGHYHLHMVPRWNGDTNFMSVVHATRVIPEALGTAWRRLRPLLNAGPGVEARAARLRARPARRRGRRPAPRRVRG